MMIIQCDSEVRKEAKKLNKTLKIHDKEIYTVSPE